jgi:two-component system cell cycle sensor histidine kinase/response regulator CckA
MESHSTKILVVDDELHVAASVTLALGRGYQVDSVSDSREAFEVLKENERGFGIVIADHRMPGWGGSELIKRIQGTGFRGKCIVLSGHLSPEVEAIYHGLGVEYVIPKPFDVVLLRNAVAATARAIEDRRN